MDEKLPAPRPLTPKEIQDLRQETKRNVAYFQQKIAEKRRVGFLEALTTGKPVTPPARGQIEPLVTYSGRPPLPVRPS